MRIIVGSLLVLSLAANAWLLVGRARVDVSRSAHASQPPASRRAEDPTGLLAGGGGGRDAARPRACRRALSRCRARGLRLMAAITAAGARRVATAGAGSGSDAAGSAGAAANKIDDAAKQQAALCDVARDHLRGHFAHHRDRIGKSLSRSLGDDAKQRKDRQHEVDRFAAALELSAAERSAL
ncbi:MAG: hypothetical protein KC503_14165, partial [Myxococcales bacterium]|nr:hypothetical protein [Myxococcales bacterium]